jgi:hypothetical protein
MLPEVQSDKKDLHACILLKLFDFDEVFNIIS